MNIRLTEVLSDVMGLTGGVIIRDIVAGERDPKALARHRHSRVKASPEDIIKARSVDRQLARGAPVRAAPVLGNV